MGEGKEKSKRPQFELQELRWGRRGDGKMKWLGVWALMPKVKVLLTQSCPTLCDPTDYIACQAPLSMESSK